MMLIFYTENPNVQNLNDGNTLLAVGLPGGQWFLRLQSLITHDCVTLNSLSVNLTEL